MFNYFRMIKTRKVYILIVTRLGIEGFVEERVVVAKRGNRKKKDFSWMIWVFRILLVFAIFAALFNRNWINFVLAITMFVVAFPVFYKEDSLPFGGMEFLVLFLIFFSMYFGQFDFFTGVFWWWQLLMRFIFGIVVVLVGVFVIFAFNNRRKIFGMSPFFIALFAFCFSVCVGLMWEFFKFLMSIWFDANLFNHEFAAEMWNLIVYVLGAFFASSLGFLHMRYFKHSFFRNWFLNMMNKNPFLFRNIIHPKDHVLDLIKKGESESVEFKSALRTNLFTKEHDKRIEHSVLKTIVAFLNTGGGTLLIGVSDEGEILGVEHDGFKTFDKFSLHLTNLVEKHIGKAGVSDIGIESIDIDGKLVVRVICGKSKSLVFMNFNGNEEFYVRFGPSSIKLSGSKLVEFAKKKLKK